MKFYAAIEIERRISQV